MIWWERGRLYLSGLLNTMNSVNSGLRRCVCAAFAFMHTEQGRPLFIPHQIRLLSWLTTHRHRVTWRHGLGVKPCTFFCWKVLIFCHSCKISARAISLWQINSCTDLHHWLHEALIRQRVFHQLFVIVFNECEVLWACFGVAVNLEVYLPMCLVFIGLLVTHSEEVSDVMIVFPHCGAFCWILWALFVIEIVVWTVNRGAGGKLVPPFKLPVCRIIFTFSYNHFISTSLETKNCCVYLRIGHFYVQKEASPLPRIGTDKPNSGYRTGLLYFQLKATVVIWLACRERGEWA